MSASCICMLGENQCKILIKISEFNDSMFEVEIIYNNYLII